jgi:hypothetical protein
MIWFGFPHLKGVFQVNLSLVGRTLNNDPGVRSGVIRARLYSYRAALISEANTG